MGPYVRQVRFSYSTRDNELLYFIRHTRYLTELTMECGSFITDISIRRISRQCPNLTKLILCGICGIVTQQSVLQLVQYCRHLSVLKLTSYQSTIACVRLVELGACPLKELTISFGVDNNNLNSSADNITTTISTTNNNKGISNYHHHQACWNRLATFKDLQHLHINSSEPRFTCFLITILSKLADWIPNITSLTINQCKTLSLHQTVLFMQTHPGLVSLGLKGLRLGDPYLEAMAMTLPNIKHVDVSFDCGMTGPGIRPFIRNCLRLEGVDLWGCKVTLDEIRYGHDGDDICDDDLWGHAPCYLGALGKKTIEQVQLRNKAKWNLEDLLENDIECDYDYHLNDYE